ncbi:MAG TPA: hypothetical protein PL033_06650 [Candidatus Brocadiia bacterium]|nr:hypothetical protein [Candidatus Brocadiia bacterium]
MRRLPIIETAIAAAIVISTLAVANSPRGKDRIESRALTGVRPLAFSEQEKSLLSGIAPYTPSEGDESDAAYHRGLVLLAGGEPDRAGAYFARAVEICPRWVEPRMFWAECLALTGLLKDADEQFKIVVRMAPQQAEPNYRAGMFLLSQGHPHALRLLGMAREIAPDRADIAEAYQQAQKAFAGGGGR